MQFQLSAMWSGVLTRWGAGSTETGQAQMDRIWYMHAFIFSSFFTVSVCWDEQIHDACCYWYKNITDGD